MEVLVILILFFVSMVWLILVLVKKQNGEENKTCDDEKAKNDEIMPRKLYGSFILPRYLDAYDWLSRNYYIKEPVNTHFAGNVKDNNDDWEYYFCYYVSKYRGSHLPSGFPKMEIVVINGHGFKCYKTEEFMLEFIAIVESLREDHDILKLCEKYGVDNNFGIVKGKPRRKLDDAVGKGIWR